MRTPDLIGKVAALLAASTLVLASSHATPLAYSSGSVALPLEAEPVGASLVTSLNSSFTGINVFLATNFTGTLLSQVWSGDTSNPYGGLTFTYVLSNDATSSVNDPLNFMKLSRFDGFQTDVSFFGLGNVPTSVERSTALNLGRQISFEFATPTRLQPGTSSAILIIQTDALAWQLGNASIIDDAIANAFTLVPDVAVPEPTTLSLALVGIVGIALRRRNP